MNAGNITVPLGPTSARITSITVSAPPSTPPNDLYDVCTTIVSLRIFIFPKPFNKSFLLSIFFSETSIDIHQRFGILFPIRTHLSGPAACPADLGQFLPLRDRRQYLFSEMICVAITKQPAVFIFNNPFLVGGNIRDQAWQATSQCFHQ